MIDTKNVEYIDGDALTDIMIALDEYPFSETTEDILVGMSDLFQNGDNTILVEMGEECNSFEDMFVIYKNFLEELGEYIYVEYNHKYSVTYRSSRMNYPVTLFKSMPDILNRCWDQINGW